MTNQWSKRVAAVICAGAILLTASTAWGEWGDGVRGGPFLLQPGVTLSAGFDSNLYYQSGSAVDRLHQSPEGTLEPRLSLQTVEGGSWDLSGQASVKWRQYFSDDAIVRNQSGMSAALDGTAKWNADGPVSLEFSENFVRSNETPSLPSDQALNRIYNRAGVMAGLHPGGQIMQTYGSYDWALYRHNLHPDIDRDIHHFGWHFNWSFLPQTAFTLEVDYRRIRYSEPFRFTGGEEGGIRNVNSNPLRLWAGLSGLIFPRVTVIVSGGYGWGRYEEGPDVASFQARSQVSYQFGNMDYNNRLRLGYEYGFADSTLGNFFTRHRIIAGYEQGFLANRLRLSADVSGDGRQYAELESATVEVNGRSVSLPSDPSDVLLGVSASANYTIRNGWTAGVRYGFRSNLTDDEVVIQGMDSDSVLRDYQRHNMMFTTTLTY